MYPCYSVYRPGCRSGPYAGAVTICPPAPTPAPPMPCPCPGPCPDTAVAPACCTTRCHTTGPDAGPNPYVVDINQATLDNPFFRRAIWTGTHLQLTLMCIAVGSEIGLEMHADLDQFLRLEQGQGVVMMGSSEMSLDFQQNVTADDAIFIPAGTWHNVINTGYQPIKLYSIYAPTQHPPGTIHCTKADSDDAE